MIETFVAPLIEIVVGLIPVFTFLIALVLLDSFKLLTFRSILLAIVVGGLFAVLCLAIGTWYMTEFNISENINIRYIAPMIEEVAKALFLVLLVRKGKVGFMVDAAIYGFAIGAGFAFIENVYYLNIKPHITIFGWMIRGLGTAVMHGGTTAIFGIISMNLHERYDSTKLNLFLPGLLIAILIHSLFNHFVQWPVILTLVQLILLPILIWLTFKRSEQILRNWMEIGLDTDVQMLEYISTGNISTTRIGRYLQTLKHNFPGEIVADMLCYIRIHLELAIRAKGVLLMQESGFKASIEKEVEEKFKELKYLERSIGKTGKRALNPVFQKSKRDLWQLYLLYSK